MESLFIDTNFHYDLDLSLFPGINDPGLSSQPALLIATSPRATCIAPAFNFNNNNNNKVINLCQNAVDLDSEDLYNFIDSFDLINMDITSNLAGTGDLENILNDILESATIDSDGCSILQDSCKSNFQCLTQGPTSICDILQRNPSDGLTAAFVNRDGAMGAKGESRTCDSVVGERRAGAREEFCQSSPAECLCVEHFLDGLFTPDLFELNVNRDCKIKETQRLLL